MIPTKIYLSEIGVEYLNDGKSFPAYDRNRDRTDNPYTSDEALKSFIAAENKKLEFAGIVRIDEFLKFINK